MGAVEVRITGFSRPLRTPPREKILKVDRYVKSISEARAIKDTARYFSALFLSALILLVGPDGGNLSWGSFGDSFKLTISITLIFFAIIFYWQVGMVGFLETPISWKSST